MVKKKTIPKEYAIIVSLMIFFALVTLVGGIRLVIIEKAKTFDLDKLDVIETDTNVDFTNINLGIKNAIEREYGIDIYYGTGLYLDSVNAVEIVDQTEIFEMLKNISFALEKYPQDLVREIEAKDYTVSIYLVSYFNDNVEALANRNTIGQFKIYISNTTNVQRALYHEFYHILDYYIKLETDEKYLDWSEYNPDGYEYLQDIDKLTSDNVYNGETGANFVTLYSKYSEKEDRAEVFATMLTANKTELFFTEGEPIKAKMDILNSVLKTTFITVKNYGRLAWE